MTDNKEKDEDILTRVRQLCDDAQDYWQENYKRGEEDRRFVTLDDAQWSDKDREARKTAGMHAIKLLSFRRKPRLRLLNSIMPPKLRLRN